jgi:F0F1-type ATP synthase delta subunit
MKKSRNELSELIGKKTMHITDYDALVNEIAAYLLMENITSDLDSIMRDVMQYRFAMGIVEATVYSAHELSQTDLDDIDQVLRTEYPQATSYIVDQKIDTSVVGGVKIEFPGAELDLSIFSRLNLFKRQVEAGKI